MENKKTNLWIINHYAIPPSLGGLSRHFYFSKFLIQMDFETMIFSASKIHNTEINKIKKQEKQKYKTENIDGVNYTFLKTCDYNSNGLARIKNMLEFPYRVLGLKRLIKKGVFKSPDIIYTSSPTPFTALSAIILARRLKVPIVTEVRDLWPESVVSYSSIGKNNPLIRCLYALEKWIYKHSDRLIFTMEGGKDYIKEKNWQNKIDLSKIENINNGKDLKLFNENKEKFVLDDKDLDNEETFKIVYTGSVRHVNNLSIVVDTAKEILNRAKENENLDRIKFLIYGDGNERDQLVKRCEEEKITNIVFKGQIPGEFVPSVVTRADVNLINVMGTPIMRFGCSLNKLFDYLAAGKPILSDLKVNYDLIKIHNCGIVTESQNEKEIADAVVRFFEMPKEEYDQMCENAKSVSKEYDFENLSLKLKNLLVNALEEYNQKRKNKK